MSTREPRAPRRGRPLKFGRPASSITVTLPDDVLAALRARDRDIGRAIVGLLSSPPPQRPRQPAVTLHHAGRRAVIVIRPVSALRRLKGVDLISLGDADRALVAFTEGLTAAAFELRVQDLMDGPPLPPEEAEVIRQLAALLRDVRRTPGRSVSGATIIVIEDVRTPVPRGAVRGSRRARPRAVKPAP